MLVASTLYPMSETFLQRAHHASQKGQISPTAISLPILEAAVVTSCISMMELGACIVKIAQRQGAQSAHYLMKSIRNVEKVFWLVFLSSVALLVPSLGYYACKPPKEVTTDRWGYLRPDPESGQDREEKKVISDFAKDLKRSSHSIAYYDAEGHLQYKDYKKEEMTNPQETAQEIYESIQQTLKRQYPKLSQEKIAKRAKTVINLLHQGALAPAMKVLVPKMQEQGYTTPSPDISNHLTVMFCIDPTTQEMTVQASFENQYQDAPEEPRRFCSNRVQATYSELFEKEPNVKINIDSSYY